MRENFRTRLRALLNGEVPIFFKAKPIAYPTRPEPANGIMILGVLQ